MKEMSYQKSGTPKIDFTTKRGREILKACDELYGSPSFYPKGVQTYLEDLREAFLRGILWCEEHPNVDYQVRWDDANEISDLNITEDDQRRNI